MVMDRNYTGLSDYKNDSKFDETIMFPNSDQYPVIEHGLEFNTPSPDLSLSNLDSDPDSLNYPLIWIQRGSHLFLQWA